MELNRDLFIGISIYDNYFIVDTMKYVFGMIYEVRS